MADKGIVLGINRNLPNSPITVNDELPDWIRVCESHSCPASESVVKNAAELYKDYAALKEIERKYEQLRIVALEGRQTLSSKLFIDFDVENKSYRLRFIKRLKLSPEYKKYYTIRIYCNKNPSEKLVENRQEDACKFWDDIDLKVKLTDDRGNSYVYPKPDKTQKQYNLLVTREDKTANYCIFKVSFAQKEYVPIILRQNSDEIEIEYSYSMSIENWGNYIERHVSFDREETIVYLQKGNYDLPDEDSVRTVSKDEYVAPKVPLAMFELIDDVNDPQYEEGYLGYKFCVDENALTYEQLSSTNLRIRWDCGSIFGDSDLNDIDDDDPGIAYKGRGST